MAHYVDGFVIPIPEKNLDAYVRMAKVAAKVWMEHGALEYRECVAEDIEAPCAKPFAKGIRAKAGETVVFSWIVYKSRAHRDKVNARVMKDPRIAAMCNEKTVPFDTKRLLYGGFKTLVEA